MDKQGLARRKGYYTKHSTREITHYTTKSSIGTSSLGELSFYF